MYNPFKKPSSSITPVYEVEENRVERDRPYNSAEKAAISALEDHIRKYRVDVKRIADLRLVSLEHALDLVDQGLTPSVEDTLYVNDEDQVGTQDIYAAYKKSIDDLKEEKNTAQTISYLAERLRSHLNTLREHNIQSRGLMTFYNRAVEHLREAEKIEKWTSPSRPEQPHRVDLYWLHNNGFQGYTKENYPARRVLEMQRQEARTIARRYARD